MSFENLRAVLGAISGHEDRTFVGTVDGCLTISVNFNYKKPPAKPAGTSRKRGRDDVQEAVEAAVERVQRGAGAEEGDSEALARARTSLYALVSRLRGAGDETAVESWGLSFKQKAPSASSAAAAGRPRLILSARLTPGVAVPVDQLLRCLGTHCTSDGMLTTQSEESLEDSFRLPLSDAAKAAEKHGQRALTLFATVEN